jgi:CheY-like chemotaxis protein
MAQPAPQILVVDDEAPIRTTLTALLERRGYEVIAAATGEEALALIHQRPFDLLLLDLQ